MSRWPVVLVVLVCLINPLRAVDPPTLESRITPLAKAHKGKIAVAVEALDTGEKFSLQGDEVMPTASLIKVAVLVEAYTQSDAGKLDLGKMLTLTKDDRVPGAGILRYHFSDGAIFSLRDALRLMIVYSDNTATNMALDQTGIKPVNERMAQLGLKETRINAKVYKGSTTSVDPERTKKYGLGSTTALETIALLGKIHRNEAASPKSCAAMIEHLKANDDKEQMVRFLPAGTVVAHKTGAVNTVRTDAGIIWVPSDPKQKTKTRPIALCVLTDQNEDQRWVVDNAAQVTIGKIAREVYDHFAMPMKP